MKKLLIVLLLSSTLYLIGQGTGEFLQQNKEWSSIQYDGINEDIPGKCSGIHYYNLDFSVKHKIGNQVMINDTAYYEVYGTNDTTDLSWSLSCYLREEESTTIVYKRELDGSEKKLYRFDMQIGDTIFNDTIWWGGGGDPPPPPLPNSLAMTCYDIDTTYINGTPKKVWYLHSLDLMMFNNKSIWVEGIGSIFGFFKIQVPYNPPVGGLAQQNKLLCCSLPDSALYADDIFLDCFYQYFYPKIVKDTLDFASVGELYQRQIEIDTLGAENFSFYLGDLTSDWISLDANTGIISGIPPDTGLFYCGLVVSNDDLNIPVDGMIIDIYVSSSSSFAQTNKQWNSLQATEAVTPYSTTTCEGTTLHRLGEVEVIGGMDYYKLWETNDTTGQNWADIGYIREDTIGNKVYYRYSNGYEILLYDFSVEEGDQIIIDGEVMVCNTVNIVYINGEPKKKLSFQKPGPPTYSAIWIEDIGSVYGLFELLKPLAPGSSELNTLLCVSEDSVQIYSDSQFTDCYYEDFYPKFVQDEFPDAYLNTYYEIQLEIDSLDVTDFSLQAVLIPDGLSFDPATAILSGTPTQEGSFSCIIRIYNEEIDVYSDIINAPIEVLAISNISLFDTNKSWSDLHTMSSPMPSTPSTFLSKFANPETINGILYYKAYQSADSAQNWSMSGYFREDPISKKIYANLTYPTNPDEDLLIYDFTITEGEEISLTTLANPGTTSNYICTDVEIINYYGIERKKITLENPIMNYNDEVWIEGIGSIFGVLNSATYSSNDPPLGGDVEILCCLQNEETLYHNSAYPNCYYDAWYPYFTSPSADTAFVDIAFEHQLTLNTTGVESYTISVLNIPDNFSFDENTLILSGTASAEQVGEYELDFYVSDDDLGFATDNMQFTLVIELEDGIPNAINENIQIFPTLIQDKIHIQTNITGTMEFKLYNTQGQELLKNTFYGSTQIDCENLPKGMYLIHVFDTDQQVFMTKKMVKK